MQRSVRPMPQATCCKKEINRRISAPCARVDLHERADVDLAVFLDGAHTDAVADGISDDEGIRPTVQEGDVERRAASRVVESGCAEGAVLAQGKDGEAIGIWRIRGDRVECAAAPLDPENRRAIWIQACGNDWLVERGADKNELLVGRDHDHGGHAVGLVVRITVYRSGRAVSLPSPWTDISRI